MLEECDNLRIGNEKHEKTLKETIQQLEKKDFKVINLEGKSPSAIAFNEYESVAVCIDPSKKKTITYLEDWYNMFDRIDRVKNDSFIDNYKDRGYSVIVLKKKSPDAIAFKNGGIFAIEIIGLQKGYSGDYQIKNKEDIYNMFDGLMIKTFIYGSENDEVFTQTFGSNKNILNKIKTTGYTNNNSTGSDGVRGGAI